MLGLCLAAPLNDAHTNTEREQTEVEEINEQTEQPVTRIMPDSFPSAEVRETVEIEVPEATPDNIEEEMYWDSLELLALCIEAEAGNQGEYGKRLVCDVILNRVDDEDFPDNIWDVIMQDNQFSVVLNNSINEVEPTDETFRVVREEIEHRTNYDVLFFTSEGYSPYGRSWNKVGAHYFSTKR